MTIQTQPSGAVASGASQMAMAVDSPTSGRGRSLSYVSTGSARSRNSGKAVGDTLRRALARPAPKEKPRLLTSASMLAGMVTLVADDAADLPTVYAQPPEAQGEQRGGLQMVSRHTVGVATPFASPL